MDSGGSEREGEKKASNKSGAVGGKGRPKGGDLLGTVELDTNLKISTQFEEEEEETSSVSLFNYSSWTQGHIYAISDRVQVEVFRVNCSEETYSIPEILA